MTKKVESSLEIHLGKWRNIQRANERLQQRNISFKLVWDTDINGLWNGNPHPFEEYQNEKDSNHVIIIQQSGKFWYAFELKGKAIKTITSGETKKQVRKQLIEMGYNLRR